MKLKAVVRLIVLSAASPDVTRRIRRKGSGKSQGQRWTNTGGGRKRRKGEAQQCGSSLHCQQLRPSRGRSHGKLRAVQRVGAAAGGPAGGVDGPACTKLMGNRSERLLPPLERGQQGRGGWTGGGPRDGRQHGGKQTSSMKTAGTGGGQKMKKS